MNNLIYPQESYRASKNFQTEEYFKKYSEVCQLTYGKTSDNIRTIMHKLNPKKHSSAFDLKALEEACSIEKLRIHNEPTALPIDIPEKLATRCKLDCYYPITEEAKQLNTIKIKEVLEKKWHNDEFNFGSKRFLKTTVVDKLSAHEKWNNILPGSTFIYSILVYRPFNINIGTRNSSEKIRFAVEIEALGTNTIAQVVDKFECVSNYAIIKEVENTKADLSQYKNAKDLYPSQTVFIDGVFYNDTRSPEAIDYSEPIIPWAKDNNIGTFTTAKMEDTLLNTLTPSIGYPYVYIHQGNCEHLITFSDVRLIQSNDCLVKERYPKIVSLNRHTNFMCFLCATRLSQWIVLKCARFPQEKVFLCTECCDGYLYEDGKKITEFQLFPYYSHRANYD